MEFKSHFFLISLLLTFSLVFFWVSFSLKEFLEHYYKERDKRKLQHLKYMEQYRDEVNKRRSF